MNQNTLTFLPLYWVYHDNWKCRTWSRDSWGNWAYYSDKWHNGHIHYFMPDFSINKEGQKGTAYYGSQKFEFSFETLNGPNSGDINQPDNIHYIGTPRWYFHVTEYWRRIYIQPWDNKGENEKINGIVGKVGIKYDASRGTRGPFREGKGYCFFFDVASRTLPIEYYRDEEKKTRDNFLNGNTAWEFPRYGEEDYKAPETRFFIPNENTIPELPYDFLMERYNQQYTYKDPETSETEQRRVWQDKFLESGVFWNTNKNPAAYDTTDEFGAFQKPYGDWRYIYPIIEYQRIVRLNYERLPGWELRDKQQGGDGFTITVNIPYTLENIIQSPFSDDEGNVSPIGTYHHDFEKNYPDQILKYPKYDKCDEGWYNIDIYEKSTPEAEEDPENDTLVESMITNEIPQHPPRGNLPENQYVVKRLDADGDPILGKRPDPDGKYLEHRIPDDLKGKRCVFRIPDGMRQDGMWVEQCLGGIVKARGEVDYEDNFGTRGTLKVETTKLILDELFEGSDQNAAT